MPTNAEVVQAALDAFGRGDIPAVLDMCSDNVEVVFETDETIIPFAGRWKGKSRVTEYFRIIGETFDVLKWRTDHTVASGDRVAAFGSMDTRAKTTGKTVINSGWALDFTVGSGKLTGWRVYADTAATERALMSSVKAAV